VAKQDRFGRRFTNVACKDKKGRGYPSGILRIGGKAYKIEPSSSRTDGVEAWVRVTELPNDRQQGGGFGGGGGGGGYARGGQRGGGL
jgi:hypothetical protein